MWRNIGKEYQTLYSLNFQMVFNKEIFWVKRNGDIWFKKIGKVLQSLQNLPLQTHYEPFQKKKHTNL